jgi:hypothetical protein
MSKIKVLFLAAYPDANPLKLDEEIRAITQKIRASEYRNTLDLASAWAVRPDDLLQTFNEHKPHIVHFSGHGSPSGEIILVDESLVNGKRVSKPISPVTIKALFQALKDNIQVVLLNACYSRIQAEAIRDVIDCVIGMNSAISDQAAITFAASFYRALGFGRSLKEAFEQGKVSLLLEGIPEDDTPELLCRSGIDPAKVFLIGHPTDSGRVSTNTLPVEIPTYPYDGFGDSFREIVFPKRFVDSNAVLHIVFGDISDIQYMTPTIPINQSFDLSQRGPHSVLASFEKVKVGGENFFDAVERAWPLNQRPSYAGIGHAHFVRLPENSHALPGVIFVVTTRDLSSSPLHYGRYVDTPVEGIEYALDRLLEVADDCKIESLALPLLGVGYANIGRTWNRPELRSLLQQITLALTIYKLEIWLSRRECSLKRGVVVIYSPESQGQFEHRVWDFVVKFINKGGEEKARQIERLVQDFARLQGEPI